MKEKKKGRNKEKEFCYVCGEDIPPGKEIIKDEVIFCSKKCQRFAG